MARYTWDDKKKEETKLIIEGVDMNDHNAVKRKYYHLKLKKIILTFISLFTILFVVAVITDFYYVNFKDAKPKLALIYKVKDGIKYKGLGYEVLICKDGTKYLNEPNKNCYNNVEHKKDDVHTYKDVLHASLLDYFKEEKLIDNNFKSFEINSYVKDSVEEDHIDYFMDINYTCKNSGSDCFKSLKEKFNETNLLIYVSVNKANRVVDIFTFKDYGVRYDELVINYTEKLKKFLINRNLLNIDNLRTLKIELLENKGKYNFDNIVYADLYKIRISYMCLDNANTCVTKIEDGKGGNLSFEAYMFINENDDVVLVESIDKIK